MPAGFYRPTSEIEPIVGIQFGIFSPEEIERRSVVEITTKDTYEGNEPKIGGLFDPRMGVLDNGKTCRSCGQSNHGCPGHFGHYRLARPVYFFQFLPLIRNVLSCVCIRCSKLLLDKEAHPGIQKKRGEARWRDVLTLSGNIKRCGQETEDGCGARQPTRYSPEGIARIVAEWDNLDTPSKEKGPKTLQPLEVEYVLHLFRRITDEDVDYMGLSRFWCRPDWMICTVLPIPPPQVRPSVVQENNQRSEDDLTHKLFDIIKNNKILQQKIEANANKAVIDEMTNVVQYHIATLVDNQIPGVAPSAQRSGRALKSIQQRLGSKEGRIRYNIQGKRVEFSARSVITPDPNISIAEIGVPMKIAMNLTKPDIVTPYNRDQLYRYVQNGADVFPGAKTIVRKDGRMISLKHVNTKEIVLHFGDTVNRHLMDGDTILFNRQPTLHRMSMMGHKVKVLPYNTFRLNVMVTSPYNADFDGDEMNAHIPQSYEASTELEEIAAVPHQIITPRDGKPVIGVVQDTLVGAYRITRPDVTINRREMMTLMMWNKRFGAPDFEGGKIMPKPGKPAAGRKARWTGQQVVSSLLPPINLDMKNKQQKAVSIRDGVLLEGQLDKEIFSKASKGIIHVTYNDYGPEKTVNLLDSLQSTIEQFLIYNGFSVGISDLVADATTREAMDEKIQARKKEIEEFLLQVHLDLFDNNTGKSNQEEFEGKVFGALNQATKEAGTLGQASLADENRLIAMVRCGSKGNEINVAQMIACVGQQNIDGKRIPYGFTDRTLPHYKKYDDGAEARGFIESSFIRGLSPQEFFFHAMSGREGLIDTAVKTADTGYIQRQLVKAMEDLVIQNDGTVRDAKMNLIQFHYGEDGVNSTKIENQSLDLQKMTEEDIRKNFGLEGETFQGVFSDGVIREDDEEQMQAFVEQILADRRLLVEGVFKKGQSIPIFSPVNIERVLFNSKLQGAFDANSQTDLTPMYVLQGIEKVIQRTQSYHHIWCALLRFHLAPHKIIKARFTKAVFDAVCERLILKNWQAQCQPGEQVGIIAAQSIGEPSTQMTLNSTDWDTRVIISCDGRIQTPQIGEFIDNYYTTLKGRADKGDEAAAARIQTLPNNQIYIELKDDHDWKAVSCGEDGVMKWTTLEAITRHPVLNEDGTNTILEVETESGRIVKATKALSFLTRSEDDQVVGIKGSDLKVGMVLPIASHLALDQMPSHIDNLNYTNTLMQKNPPLRNDVTEDVIWDPIKSIKEVTPMKEWVYDLTVAETRNFTTHDGIVLKDTFHLAGVAAKSNVTRGVPRLKELLKVTQNPKATSLTVFLKPEYRGSKDRAREVAQDLELTLLKDIVVKAAIYYDPKDEETVLAEDRDFIKFFKMFEAGAEDAEAEEPWSKWMLRLELDRERMFNKNISMDDINLVLREKFSDEINTIYSDFNSPRLIMRIRLSVDPTNGVDLASLDDLTSIKKMQNRVLTSVVIRGVPSIKAVTYRKSKDHMELVNGVYTPVEEYVLDTDGSNIVEVINHPMVDATRIYTTHVYDVLDLLGIEAARTILLTEITGLFEEVGLNFRHLGILCDVMTRAGRLMSVDRYGINKNDIGPLAKASFEETEKILLKAALFGEVDPITGVSANIMTGQPIRGGTAFSQIMLDEAALMRLQEGLPPTETEEEEDDEDLTQDEIDRALYTDPDDLCNSTRLRVNMTLPAAGTYLDEADIEINEVAT